MLRHAVFLPDADFDRTHIGEACIMALWRCRVPEDTFLQDAGIDDGVVVEAETEERAQALAKREFEMEGVALDQNGRTVEIRVSTIVCERIDED